ncbi:unnamed protein product [Caenorhabditis brenneri]
MTCNRNNQWTPNEEPVDELQQLMTRINQLLGTIAHEKLAIALRIVELKRSKVVMKRKASLLQDLIQCKIHGGYANAGFSHDGEDYENDVEEDIEDDEEEEGPVILIRYKKHAFDA